MQCATLSVVIAALAVSSCATRPEVFAPVTHQDVGQIAAVVRQRPDIRKPILRIDADEAGTVRLTTGQHDTAGDRFNTFKMAKRAGRWTIISPIEEDRIIVTSADAHRLH
jgi:hypothetical protein